MSFVCGLHRVFTTISLSMGYCQSMPSIYCIPVLAQLAVFHTFRWIFMTLRSYYKVCLYEYQIVDVVKSIYCTQIWHMFYLSPPQLYTLCSKLIILVYPCPLRCNKNAKLAVCALHYSRRFWNMAHVKT